MTPRRGATYIALLLLPAILWTFVQAGKNDLLLATRSLMSQSKKAGDGMWGPFYARYHFPEGNPSHQQPLFEALWARFRDCTPRESRYGDRSPHVGADRRERPHREVVIRGDTRSGELVTISVDWVSHAGNWYILDYRDYDGTAFSERAVRL